MTAKRGRQADAWANLVTANYWAKMLTDSKCMNLWTRNAEAVFRRSFRDEPMPGIWPKYCARVEVGMAIFQALEESGKRVPAGFFGGSVEMDIQDVDCYAIAERLLDDEMVQRFGDGPGRIAKKGRTKRKGR